MHRNTLYASLGAAALFGFLWRAEPVQAYMTDSSHIENHLSIALPESQAEITLTEPSWEAPKGLGLVPGMTIPKDPQLTNTSQEDVDELAAIRLEFTYGDGYFREELRGKTLSSEDMRILASLVEIDYEADKEGERSWKRFETETAESPVQHFYYSQILHRNFPEAGEVTVPVFENLHMSALAGNEAYLALQNLGGFEIHVEGYALAAQENLPNSPLSSARAAYEAGLFSFSAKEDGTP